MKTGVLLINVGTPDSPELGDVRRYLSEFLNDPYVIDLPWLSRKILVNGVIIPFRAKNSSELYKRLWTENGSPLLINSINCAEKLQVELGEDYVVRAAMRYQNPSIKEALLLMKNEIDNLVVVPMYPQYAESSTRTSIEKTNGTFNRLGMSMPKRIVEAFYNDQGFLSSFASKINNAQPELFDHILFSFHGLPERHLTKLHNDGHSCLNCSCEREDVVNEDICYKAQCYKTVRSLVGITGMKEGDYSVGFQSRLDKKWLTPFSDVMISDMAKHGVRRLLVVSPAFVADCLETTVEIGFEYKELFKHHGGKDLVLVESLNDSEKWVKALAGLVKREFVK